MYIPLVRFHLIDGVLEQDDDRIVAFKRVTMAEEYLADHFEGFPVLPGVMMIEVMTQAARRLVLDARGWSDPVPPVLGGIRGLKYAHFVRPGWTLVAEVTFDPKAGDDAMAFRGTAYAVEHDLSSWRSSPVAASGRLSLRAARLSASRIG